MSPKQKAIQLFNQYSMLFLGDISKYDNKESAKITVDEILEVLKSYWDEDCKINQTKISYWIEVKKEIENL